jgi:hypothetical protein
MTRPMKTVRHIVTIALALAVLTPVVACGGDKEKKLKECAEHCRTEAEACEKRHEKNCGDLAKSCADRCEKDFK